MMTMANYNPVAPERRSRRPLRRGAFSLIEVLIAVTLMSVIVLGLMAMFGETQRAFRTGITQSDVMESGRAAMEMMAREIEQAQATDQPGGINFNIGPNPYAGSALFGFAPPTLQPYQLEQSLPQTVARRLNILQDVLFVTREGQEWTAIGYAVVYTNYIGTLYRYQTNIPAVAPDWQYAASVAYNTFFSPNPTAVRPSRVIDGVVNFQIRAYDTLGQLISPAYAYRPLVPGQIEALWGPRPDDIHVRFLSNALPAYVEVELGILETKTADRARNMPLNGNVQQAYLEKQAARVQVFRQRIPIRNVDPSVYQ